MISNPIHPMPGSRQPRSQTLVMNAERFAGHHEEIEALVLSLAGVTSLMLIAYLLLLTLY